MTKNVEKNLQQGDVLSATQVADLFGVNELQDKLSKVEKWFVDNDVADNLNPSTAEAFWSAIK